MCITIYTNIILCGNAAALLKPFLSGIYNWLCPCCFCCVRGQNTKGAKWWHLSANDFIIMIAMLFGMIISQIVSGSFCLTIREVESLGYYQGQKRRQILINILKLAINLRQNHCARCTTWITCGWTMTKTWKLHWLVFMKIQADPEYWRSIPPPVPMTRFFWNTLTISDNAKIRATFAPC